MLNMVQVWFGLELLWPFNPDDLNDWSKRSWLRYLNHLFLIGRKWTVVTFSSLATYSLHLSLALFILKILNPILHISSTYIICLNKYNKSSFLTFSCLFFFFFFFSNLFKCHADDKVTVLESEKLAWEGSTEAQAVKEALNPWRHQDAIERKDS